MKHLVPHRHRITILTIATALLCFTSEAEKWGKTVISKTPWDPTTLSSDPKVIYGNDDRLDIYEETNPDRAAWAASTCGLIDAAQLLQGDEGQYSLSLSEFQVNGDPACTGEPFAAQPTAPFCTGFVVGADLIATAGHCIDELSMDSIRFIFGFQMLDAQTPTSTFDESQVYTPTEIVASGFGDYDYAIVRVDKFVTAPGAAPLPVRQTGTIPIGANVGVIGHPWGLPTKIAFGESTLVRDNAFETFFVSNLDSFGGNSGSPVFNADTGIVEGILVRGDQDWNQGPNCFRSNSYSNTGGFGEDTTKSTIFAEFISNSRGQLHFDKAAYACDDVLNLSLVDGDLKGTGSATVTVVTDAGDFEHIELLETDFPGVFEGDIPVMPGTATPENGVLEAAESTSIAGIYNDADDGLGAQLVSTVGATVDCSPPIISNVEVTLVRGFSARIALETNEATLPRIEVGTECGTYEQSTTGELMSSHSLRVGGLNEQTTYHFRVTATDPAGNSVVDDNDGACYTFTTTDQIDPFTEPFLDGFSDLKNLSLTLTPNNSSSAYEACVDTRFTFPTTQGCGIPLVLGDDAHQEYVFSEGKTFTFYDQTYDRMFVGSNGYITFGEGDSAYAPELAQHFALPRIAPYYADMYPPQGGLVEVLETDDRVALTFADVYDFFGDLHSFQAELFFDGTIRMTWLRLTQPFGIIGISAGQGLDPNEFEPSDLSAYTECLDQSHSDLACDTPFVSFPACGSSPTHTNPLPSNLLLMAATLLLLLSCTKKHIATQRPTKR